jgi:hydrogenase expression/formation protein HypC
VACIRTVKPCSGVSVICLAIPALLLEKRDHDIALVDLGGIRKPVSVALVPEAEAGDYVIVHAGYAIGVLDPEEAANTLALFAAMQAADGSAGA